MVLALFGEGICSTAVLLLIASATSIMQEFYGNAKHTFADFF